MLLPIFSDLRKNRVFMYFPDPKTILHVHLFILRYSRVQKLLQCLLNYAIHPIRTRKKIVFTLLKMFSSRTFSPLSSMYHTIVRCHS